MLPRRLILKIWRTSAWPSIDVGEDGLEHALEGLLDVLDQVVDDAVLADVDLLLLGQLLGAGVGAWR